MANDHSAWPNPSNPWSEQPWRKSYRPGYSPAQRQMVLDRMAANIRWQKAWGLLPRALRAPVWDDVCTLGLAGELRLEQAGSSNPEAR